jgi:hypothetical protein
MTVGAVSLPAAKRAHATLRYIIADMCSIPRQRQIFIEAILQQELLRLSTHPEVAGFPRTRISLARRNLPQKFLHVLDP